ncbi:unnamed protein product [Medioppia subpectinata]|uniref:DNA polymerase eta n=1 Tax=Medioppia subpectinata TaxID=1979941 RepID=A0A7R9KE86_9ACAR|nr:unnamed protein product [Medioppia subpectinata]CAG2101766.1 unnamed protein product [Medioppia subpectinata]
MSSDRVIALIDMDCFYVQCEQRLAPNRWSQPCAVAQYNNWKGGGLIAVNYEARDRGVKRGMRGTDATALCPELHIFSVPEVRGKADLTRYRDCSHEVFAAMTQLVATLSPDIVVEKASVDEAFIDLTKYVDQLVARLDPIPAGADLKDTKLEMNADNNCGEDDDEEDVNAGTVDEKYDLTKWLDLLRDNVFAFANEIRLAFGALIVQQIRAEIATKTEFKCSAGISHNKTLAKLACGINKPNAQTILPRAGVDQFFKRMDISKVRSLGGKLGQSVKQAFGVNTMYELKCLDFIQLCRQYDQKTAKWLKEMGDGLDDEPVSDRQLSKSIGCGKNFPGKTCLTTIADIKHWVRQLCEELVERIARDKEMNKRSPKLLTVSYRLADKTGDHNSRSVPLLDEQSTADATQLVDLVMRQVFSKMAAKMDPLTNLMIAASKFVDDCDDPSHNTHKLDNYFSKVNKSQAFKTHGSASAAATDGNDPSAKRFKSFVSNTKTLKDFWTNNSTNSCNNINHNLITSEPSVSDGENGSDVEIIETNVAPNDASNNAPNNLLLNTTNTTTDNTTRIKAINHKTKSDKTMNGKPIVTKSIYEQLVRRPKRKGPPTKPGFFRRKAMQFKAEAKAKEERERLERTAKKSERWERLERQKRIEKSGKTKITGYFKPKSAISS